MQPKAWLCSLLLLACCFGVERIVVAGEETPADKTAFLAAENYFKGTFYSQSETAFANFLATYTNSLYRPAAFLYQARARYEQSNYVGVIELLRKELPGAGELSADYQYWIAESLAQKKELPAAAEAYANLITNYEKSPVRMKAAFGQALVYSKMKDWGKVIELLGKPDSVFQKLAREQRKDPVAVSGFFLLAQALFKQKQFAEGEKAVAQIGTEGLPLESKWQRQYLLCRMQLAGGHPDQALLNITNLVSLASGQRRWEAESTFLQAEIFESMNQLTNALQLYLTSVEGLPADLQREALFKSVQIMLTQKQFAEAIKSLVTFVEQHPQDTALDQVRLLLGELTFKAYFLPLEVPTNSFPQGTNNFLIQATTNFERIIIDFPDSPSRGKAHLNLGWCLWEQGRIAEAKTNFLEAANRLPLSEDQAIARFKLADAQYLQKEFGPALTNYLQVVQEYEKNDRIKANLFDLALYHVLRASMELGDQTHAQQAASRIVKDYPQSLFAERSQLLLGKDYNRKGNYAEARKVFSDLIERFPQTAALPEARLAIAQSYLLENQWSNAAAHYDKWVANFAQHSLLPQAEFSRALAHDKAGNHTNALTLFTEFVSRFPTHSLAPLAQNWIADYHFNREDFVKAESNYQKLYQEFPNATNLAFQARLMAGRAAFARQGSGTDEARRYFADLLMDTNAPSEIVNETYFELGITILQQATDSKNQELFGNAINAFSKITNGIPTNNLAPLALMKIGDCYKLSAELIPQPELYTNAARAYEGVLLMPQADLTSRSEAEYKLGFVAERQQKSPDEALNHYLKVLFERNPERFDPYWIKEAGVAAARICESRNDWERVISVYNSVLTAIPSLRPNLEKKISAARARLEAAK